MPDFILPQFAKMPWWKKWWGIVLILFFGCVVIFGAWFGISIYMAVLQIKSGAMKPLTVQSADFTNGQTGATGAASAGAQLVRSEDVSVGDVHAQNTIVEFGDFECPFTAKEFPVIRPLIEKMLGVHFVFRNYPLTSIHQHAYDAAMAAACANAQGKFWQYHDQLFLNQTDLSVDGLKQDAKVVGLDAATFGTCMDNQTYKAQITRDVQDGYSLGVRGTPTFFVNGVKIEGAIPMDGWTEILKRIGVSLAP